MSNLPFYGPVSILVPINDTHLVGALYGDIIYWKLSELSLQEIQIPCKIKYALCVDTLNELVAVGDINKSIIVF